MDLIEHLIEGTASCRDHELMGAFAGPFALPGDRARYPRDRVVDMKHVRLDITLDLDAKRISGGRHHTRSAPSTTA